MSNRFGCCGLSAVLAFALAGCGAETPSISPGTSGHEIAAVVPPQRIEKFCGHCHAFPQPRTFARGEWRAEVSQGFRFYEGAENLKLDVPVEEEVIAFYEAAAPESLPAPVPHTVEAGSLFQPQAAGDSVAMSVSGLASGPTPGELWAPDMRTGAILKSEAGGQFVEAVRPVECANPCRLTWADLDRDGTSELLVSDLGSFFPQDHQNGAVWKLDPAAAWKCTPVLQGVSRVADTQAGDLDGDGDIDLVVAEFGWRRTGRVLVLWNPGHGEFTDWKQQVLDPRHGAIDVPLVDINQDGRLDIIVLISQEFETVLAYLNQGDGKFEPQTLYAAGEPSFGSSGIQLVDFDRDGDLDVIHANGDSFDSSYVKPYHGVRWIENTGKYPFQVHEVQSLAGVHRAVAGDIDLDGDLDLAAVSLLPPSVMQNSQGLPSAVWFENTADGKFAMHVIEIDSAHHTSCILVDKDQDGDLDLVATNFRWQEESGPPVTWYINQTKSP